MFDKEKYMIHYEKLKFTWIKTKKKKYRVLESNQSQWLKQYVELITHKKE